MGDVVTIGDATLVHGDALAFFDGPGKDTQADCFVSDPPYRLESGGQNGAAGQTETTGGHRPMAGKFDNRHYNNDGNIVKSDIGWPEIMGLVSSILPHGHAYIMANNRHVYPALSAAEAAGLRFHNILVWDKGAGTPNRWYMKNCEFTLLLFTGKAKPINNCGSRQLIRVPNIRGADHPTEKPVALMQHYIENSTSPGDLVVDPFMGVGSTAVACLRSGRRFIGCEIDRHYFDLACRRVGASSDHTPSLFGSAA